MSASNFEILITTRDPDAMRAWITQMFPGEIASFCATQVENDGAYVCLLCGKDETVGAAIKLFWHNPEK